MHSIKADHLLCVILNVSVSLLEPKKSSQYFNVAFLIQENQKLTHFSFCFLTAFKIFRITEVEIAIKISLGLLEP